MTLLPSSTSQEQPSHTHAASMHHDNGHHHHCRTFTDSARSALKKIGSVDRLTPSVHKAPAVGETQQEPASSPFQRALTNNKKWSSEVQAARPDYLPTLAKSQAPKILWIGCSDSRVPAETITGLNPGELFVHRNIANVLNPTDLSSLSVIEYACKALKVQHIVVCGHANCGGVNAALGNKKIGKIDTWLAPLRRLRMRNFKELDALKDPADKTKKLVELNVRDGVETLRENPDVVEAQNDRGLTLHGVVYDLATGQLIDLEIEDSEEVARKDAFELS